MLKGKAWKFGDGISTDHIAPGRYFHLRSNMPELAKHVLEDADPEFASKMTPGDFVVGGKNFRIGIIDVSMLRPSSKWLGYRPYWRNRLRGFSSVMRSMLACRFSSAIRIKSTPAISSRLILNPARFTISPTARNLISNRCQNR